MNLNKIKICSEASERLKTLKMRTGLTPNILCRIGLCLSLREPNIPDVNAYDDEGSEFNRYTLTGEWDKLFIALFKQRCVNDGIAPDELLEPYFLAHLNRGVLSLHHNCKNLGDLQRLIPTG